MKALFGRLAFTGTAVTILSLAKLQAASGTWANNTGNLDSNWSNATNWVSSNIPGDTNLATANTDIATFSAATVVETPILDSNRRLGSISIDNSQADYSINSSGAFTLALQSAGGLTITGGGSTTIAPLINIVGPQTWNTGSASVLLQNGLTMAGNRILTLTNTSAVVVQGTVTASATAVLSFGGTGSMDITGDISGPIGFESVASYSGTVSLSGANTFNASLIWRSGNLNLGSSSALGTGSNNLQIGTTTAGSSAVNVLTTGAYTIARNITVSASTTSSTHTIGGSQTSGTSVYSGTVTMNNHPGGFRFSAASGGRVNFTNTVSGGSANDSITKVGAGIVALSGSNTYVGGTTVSVGTLLINNSSGSGTGTGAVSVASAATLGGTGRIVPTGTNGISVTGSVAAGDGGIGTLTFDLTSTTGKVQMNSGSDFKFELGVANVSIGSIAAGSSDLITLAGAAAADFVFNGNTADFLGTGSAGYYKLFDTSSDNANTWSNLVFDNTTGIVSSGLAASNFASGLSGTFIVGTAFNGAVNQGDIYLMVVPEPSTWGLLGLGLAALIGCRFRRGKL